jgi:hypothetical protein
MYVNNMIRTANKYAHAIFVMGEFACLRKEMSRCRMPARKARVLE